MADHFVALIAQSGPFGVQKHCFLARNKFFVASLKKIVAIMMGHLNDNLLVLTALQGGLREIVQVLFGQKIGPKI